MFTPNEKKKANCHIIETESKTKSSSIKDEKEAIITNTTYKKKKKIKRNKTSGLNFKNSNNHTQNNIKDKGFIIGDNEKIQINSNKKIYNKTIQNETINYIKKNYNLAEAYLKNNTFDNLQKMDIQDYNGISNVNEYDIINIKSKINNNFNKDNINIVNNNLLKDFDKYNTYKYNQEQIEEEDKKYTVSYRDKMINELKKKLNKDDVVNESLTELQFDSQSMNIIKNTNQNIIEKNSNFKSSKDNKIKKVKFVNYYMSEENKKYMKNSQDKSKLNNIKNKIINNLDTSKNKDIKNIFEIIQKNKNIKNKKSYLLIKDLLNNKMVKSSFITFNDNINIDNCYTQSFRKKSNKNKNKNGYKNKANIINSEMNKNKNNDYINKKFINSIIHKRLESDSLKKIKIIKNQTLSGNLKKRGCVIKNNNQLTCKNSLTNILNKNTKNIKSKSFNNKYKDKKNNNMEMVLYNIKNRALNTINNNFFNKTMIKDNNYLKKSILIKDNNNKDINKTSNLADLNLNLKNKNNYNNNNFIKNNDKKNIYCKIIKNKTRIKIEFINPIIPPPLIEDNKLNIKDNNYKSFNLTSILKNDYKNKNMSFNTNNYNYKSQKKASITEKIYNTIEERDKRIKFQKKKTNFKSINN